MHKIFRSVFLHNFLLEYKTLYGMTGKAGMQLWCDWNCVMHGMHPCQEDLPMVVGCCTWRSDALLRNASHGAHHTSHGTSVFYANPAISTCTVYCIVATLNLTTAISGHLDTRHTHAVTYHNTHSCSDTDSFTHRLTHILIHGLTHRLTDTLTDTCPDPLHDTYWHWLTDTYLSSVQSARLSTSALT